MLLSLVAKAEIFVVRSGNNSQNSFFGWNYNLYFFLFYTVTIQLPYFYFQEFRKHTDFWVNTT